MEVDYQTSLTVLLQNLIRNVTTTGLLDYNKELVKAILGIIVVNGGITLLQKGDPQIRY